MTWLKTNIHQHLTAGASFSDLFHNRGIIVFENKTYILEPLEGATNEHKIYRAENLKIGPGSCGHHFNISGITVDDTAQSSQAFTGRVGGKYRFVFLDN